MSKELEALKIGIPKLKKLYENSAKEMSSNDILGFDFTFSYLDKALQRLEAIDNSNPNEALEDFENLRCNLYNEDYLNAHALDDCAIIKQALLKAQEQEKVLEVLFKKQVDLGWLWYCVHECINSLDEYNKKMPIEKFKLTEEEFDLIKEMLR